MLRVALVGCVLVLAGLASAAPVPADPPFTPEVEALLKQLTDPDAEVRRVAISELRMLARRVDVVGGKRDRLGKEFAPKVRGLVPYLIRAAATDESESNRGLALYALADTLDTAAVVAIRERLKDKSESVRLVAACMLTEFKDAAGLDELKKAVVRFRADPKAAGSFEVERLLASMERITGKSFGQIPPNPFLASDGRIAEASMKQYAKLLDAWAAWWDWTPPEK